MMTTGLVLAGGASERFGSYKALALFDGRPLVRRVCDALRPRCDELIVSVATPKEAPQIEAVVPDVRVVADKRRGRGPIEGFSRGFVAARGDLVLVAPTDAPLLRPELYDGLLSILGDHEAAVPRHDSMDPVRAVYRRGVVARVLRDAGVASPSALVDRLDTVFLEGPALSAFDPRGASFVDINRREDLDRALRVAALRA